MSRSEEKRWTVLALLRWTTEYFRSHGVETPRLDAEVLLAHVLATERLRLYLDFEKPVEAAERARYRELIKRRAGERVPVALLVGRREFWSLPLRVCSDVLVPRPETETLVEAALGLLPDVEAESRVLDLGTGSGAVALALAKERPKARVTATDLSSAALAVAEENALVLDLSAQLRLLAGDGFLPVAGERFDLIVSNPPYVGEDEAGSLLPELAHEPREALFSGPDGTQMLRRIVAEAPAHLERGAALAVEVAPAQASVVTAWMQAAGFQEVQVHRDLADRPRVVAGRWPGEEE